MPVVCSGSSGHSRVTMWSTPTQAKAILSYMSSSYVALQLFIEFWPSQPTLSIFLYLEQARVFQFGTFSFCISFLASSTQRVLGLPIGLLEIGFQEYIAFTILVSCILSM